MNPFKKIVEVSKDGLVETLHWDGREGFMLEAYFPQMGQRIEAEKLPFEARTDVLRWSQLDQYDDAFKVTFVDDEAVDKIMEGIEWHPLKAAR